MKALKRYKKIIIVIVVIILIAIVFFTLKDFLYPNDLESVYGNRLDGIDNVKITSNKKTAVVNSIKTNTNVIDASIDVKGKIIYIMIDVNKDMDVSKLKTLFESSLTNFSSKEKEYYDFQLFGVNEGLKFKLIGAKSKQSEDIIFEEISEVEENEEEK